MINPIKQKNNPQPTGNLPAYLLLTFTALCWGFNAVFGRMAVGEVSPMALVTLRWVGVLVLLVFVAYRHLRRDWRVLRRHWLYVFIMGISGFAAFNAFFYVAAHSTTALNIGIIQGSIPVFVLIGAYAAYRTRVTVLQAGGVLITLFGVMIVGSGGDLGRFATLSFNRGDLLMVAACVFYAGYAIGLRRRPALAALSLFAAMAGAAFLASLPLVFAEAALGQLQWPSSKGWIIIAMVAVFPSFLAQLAFIHSVALIGPGRAGVFVNLVPVFASILAVAFLGESFETFHALALGLVLGGIWLSERHKAG